MRITVGRLRWGELVAGFGAVALLICLFLLPWWGLTGRLERLFAAHNAPTTVNAWHSLSFGRWLMLVTIAVTLVLVVLQATRPAPAGPVTLSMLAMVLGMVTALELIYRVLISGPYSGSVVDNAKSGAYLGLLSSLVLAYGAFRSLREETRPDPAGNAQIPVVRLPADDKPS
jgi:hypothetical protein